MTRKISGLSRARHNRLVNEMMCAAPGAYILDKDGNLCRRLWRDMEGRLLPWDAHKPDAVIALLTSDGFILTSSGAYYMHHSRLCREQDQEWLGEVIDQYDRHLEPYLNGASGP